MRTFYAGSLDAWRIQDPVRGGHPGPAPDAEAPVDCALRSRVAFYADEEGAPYVEDVLSDGVEDHIGALTGRVYDLAREAGGDIPETAIREVVENLVHARFREPVISIFDGGQTIRVSDAGPGIPDPNRAMLPGFTTADGSAKRYIRGVGSGLPIARESLSSHGGSLAIDSNLGGGAVVTLSARRACVASGDVTPPDRRPEPTPHPTLDMAIPESRPHVSTRHKRVLALVMEAGEAGPSLVARELGVGLSTAHRDLASLEAVGLIASGEGGKRALTQQGASYLEECLSVERNR
jgi:hypothetical protein